MSQENVDIVLRMFEAFNQRDRITLEALWRSDATIDWSPARGPLKGVYRGVDERRAFYEEFWSTFQSGRTETYDVVEAGDVSSSRTPATGGAATRDRGGREEHVRVHPSRIGRDHSPWMFQAPQPERPGCGS